MRFLDEKKDWILQHKKDKEYLEDGARIGSMYTLRILVSKNTRTSSVIQGNAIIIRIPENMLFDDMQKKLQHITKKALQKSAEVLLPQRLAACSEKSGLHYSSLEIKPLQSRWGSCSSRNDIVLNTYLLQLPWELVDYVIYHELSHTRHHDHSDRFWKQVEALVPDYKKRRSMLKKYPTTIFDMRTVANFVS
jgi:predicted metal-dependent hydrolase